MPLIRIKSYICKKEAMIKLLFRIALFLVLGILLYNRFFGTAEEKAHSKAIIEEAKALGKASWALLKSEKEKLNQGKYDNALDRIETLFGQLRTRARSENDRNALDQLAELEQQRRTLETRMERLNAQKVNASGMSERRAVSQEEAVLKADLRKLLDQTESVMQYME
jgi:hypothetical protein